MNELKRQEKTIFVNKILILAVLAVVMAAAIGHFATAQDVLLKTAEKTLYAGDFFHLPDYFSEEQQVENVTYAIADTDESKDIVELSEDGTVKALKEGTAHVVISYKYPESIIDLHETFTVNVLAPQKLSAVYGEELPAIQALDYYSMEDYEVILSEDSLSMSEDKICVEGFKDSVISLKKKESEESAFDVASVDIMEPAFQGERFARAAGTEAYTPGISYFLQAMPDKIYQQEILDAGKMEWTLGGTQEGEPGDASNTDDENAIAKITEQGILALKEGTVKVSVVLTAKNGDMVTLNGELIVTNPVLKTTQLVVAKGVTVPLTVDGTCEVSTYVRAKSEEEALKDYAYISGGLNVYARAKGVVDVTVLVDGRPMTSHVIVTNPKFTSSAAIMYKTQTITVKLKGLDSKYSKVVLSSSNTKVATVTQKGVVKAKKSGRVRIYASVDHKKIYELVEVSSKAGYQASKKAIAISKTKTTYSQLRRMSKGYYDCSSLVSRIYRNYGVYFGVKRGWSPTAAAIGKWCTDNKKVIAKKAVPYTKLLPGDVICYSYTKNGRFRNISHIEIYVGNGKNVSASSSRGRVVHYDYGNGSTVLVARPKK